MHEERRWLPFLLVPTALPLLRRKHLRRFARSRYFEFRSRDNATLCMLCTLATFLWLDLWRSRPTGGMLHSVGHAYSVPRPPKLRFLGSADQNALLSWQSRFVARTCFGVRRYAGFDTRSLAASGGEPHTGRIVVFNGWFLALASPVIWILTDKTLAEHASWRRVQRCVDIPMHWLHCARLRLGRLLHVAVAILEQAGVVCLEAGVGWKRRSPATGE